MPSPLQPLGTTWGRFHWRRLGSQASDTGRRGSGPRSQLPRIRGCRQGREEKNARQDGDIAARCKTRKRSWAEVDRETKCWSVGGHVQQDKKADAAPCPAHSSSTYPYLSVSRLSNLFPPATAHDERHLSGLFPHGQGIQHAAWPFSTHEGPFCTHSGAKSRLQQQPRPQRAHWRLALACAQTARGRYTRTRPGKPV